MRIGQYKPETTITLLDGRIDPSPLVTEEFRDRYAHPGMTDEDLFCLVFFDFSRSIKVAYLDEGPLTPQETHDRGATVYARAQEERARQSRERGKRRRAMREYLDFCETIHERWCAKNLEVPEGYALTDAFVPEPYLAFGGVPLDYEDGPRLILLTTNPGNGMPFQARESVKEGSYRELQAELAKRYAAKQSLHPEKERISRSASTRIRKMGELGGTLKGRGLVASDGFLQCEIVPLHSKDLRNKSRFVEMLAGLTPDHWLSQYIRHLRNVLAINHVVTLDASNQLGTGENLWTGWLGYKADLMGFDADLSKNPHTKRKDKAETVRFEGYTADGLARGYCLMRSGNHFAQDVDGMCRAILDPGATGVER